LVEIFLIPGFGFVGITGIVLIVASLILSMIFNIGFDFQLVPPTQILGKIFLVLSSVIIGFFLSIWVGKKVITTETRFGTLAFNTVLNSEEGYIAQDMRLADLIGRDGITITFMRPSGKVEIDGEIYDAVSDVGLIDKNEEVEVIKFENAQLVVTKKNKNI
jgi:membrane-bound serine protease (ClpP class)